MIVLGADTHKRSHTIAAVSPMTGELLGEQTVPSGAKGSAALLSWARSLGAERVWAPPRTCMGPSRVADHRHRVTRQFALSTVSKSSALNARPASLGFL
jgi:hypothetical protein